jgi:putative protease
MRETPELLAPGGNWDCVRAAVANGADAVYFGLPRFNARMRADNFTEEDLPKVVEFCHQRGVRAYVAFNTLVFTSELEAAAAQLRLLNRAGVDALIVQDIGLAWLARELTPGLAIHASTQMTITSPEGVRFARELGAKRVVLARELSLREIRKFGAGGAPTPDSQTPGLPLEVFVHGALCVAYSGQCLTSESLGQRSANRGECAQACRMPYELIVDGALRDLGDRRYLLSPQDLAATDEIPALIELGVVSFKIEGRLKSPEYVAAVTQVYRKAIDSALAHRENAVTDADRYQLEMTFSRGLFSGWLHGANHQKLVAARFGKKRGPLAGRVLRTGEQFVELESPADLKPGDGVVFDTGGDPDAEQGGRIWQVKAGRLFFEHGRIDFSKLKPGDRVWKTDDPELNNRLRKSFAGNISARRGKTAVDLRITGKAGEPMVLKSSNSSVRSAMPLQTARTAPLTLEKLRAHLGRFGETVYELGELENALEGEVILPIGELNRMRRELVFHLDAIPRGASEENKTSVREILDGIRSGPAAENGDDNLAHLSVLCRDMDQIGAALACGVQNLYADFEDIRRYSEVVERVRATAGAKIHLATPRIQKAGEQGFFKLIENAEPDGVLIRNPGAIEYFREKPLKNTGDFSLNVANPLSASVLMGRGLNRLTVSYDLNIEQVLALVESSPRGWFELTLHQHMPMFHMDHCIYAAFMSDGTDHTNCGRPCDRHRVHLRDRMGIGHPLRADVGCRNTLFNAVAQTGARFFPELRAAGLRHFRIELLEESAGETRSVIEAYQALLGGKRDGETLWRELKAQSQLGVTHGTLELKRRAEP